MSTSVWETHVKFLEVRLLLELEGRQGGRNQVGVRTKARVTEPLLGSRSLESSSI